MTEADGFNHDRDRDRDRDRDFVDQTQDLAKNFTPIRPDSDDEDVWSSEDAFETLRMERTVHPDETPEQMTKRILEQAGPAAATSIVHIALHSTNDNTRLNAAKYITDLVYADDSGKAKAPWEDLVAEVISQAELHANVGQG